MERNTRKVYVGKVISDNFKERAAVLCCPWEP